MISSLEQNSDNLLRYLLLVELISMILILSNTGYGMYRQSKVKDVLYAAEDEEIRISNVILEESGRVFFSTNEQIITLDKKEI